VLATICAVILGGGMAPQPESIKTVAAFEIPLQSKADREQFLRVLRAAAEVEGMHVDASNDEEAVASTMDQSTTWDKCGLYFRGVRTRQL
jgi:hypothetical protein